MREIDDIASFLSWLDDGDASRSVAIQQLDLVQHAERLIEQEFAGTLFLGCTLRPDCAGHIVQSGGFVTPQIQHSFDVHRARLYTVDELFEGFAIEDPRGWKQTRDYAIYREYQDAGGSRASSIATMLCRRLHDHSISDALHEVIAGRKVVAVMGGHGMERGHEFYARIARLSRELTRTGYLLVSGGGPGAMEATHVGAWFAQRPIDELARALELLAKRPANAPAGQEYADADWLARAFRVREAFPMAPENEAESLSIGIPTWTYGHEPPAPFALAIAKYFANSVREAGLLAIASHGVIFAPGSAGTTQEIFQDACQNHYETFGKAAPMILFGKKFWTEERPVWPLLEHVARGRAYGDLLGLTDDPDEVVARIAAYDG